MSKNRDGTTTKPTNSDTASAPHDVGGEADFPFAFGALSPAVDHLRQINGILSQMRSRESLAKLVTIAQEDDDSLFAGLADRHDKLARLADEVKVHAEVLKKLPTVFEDEPGSGVFSRQEGL